MSKSIKIIKNRSDIGAGTRGADLGIDAIEIAAINNDSDFFNQFEFEDLETENESIYNKVNNSFGKRIEQVFEQCSRLSNAVQNSIEQDKFPLVLSGDHSSALGTISGLKAANPSKRIGVVWIDAHADIHSPYTSPSGNIHGMPLAAALSEDNIACKVNNISAETKNYWDKLKNIGCDGTKILASDLVYFGVRDTEDPEDNQIDELCIKNYMVHEVRYRGLDVCVNEALNKLSDCDMIYISFDVDSMDCDLISYGTGTPVPKGFDHHEIISIINQLVASQKVACLELVEVNPLLDFKGNKMAETAFEVLNEVSSSIKKNI
jgi:arginase